MDIGSMANSFVNYQTGFDQMNTREQMLKELQQKATYEQQNRVDAMDENKVHLQLLHAKIAEQENNFKRLEGESIKKDAHQSLYEFDKTGSIVSMSNHIKANKSLYQSIFPDLADVTKFYPDDETNQTMIDEYKREHGGLDPRTNPKDYIVGISVDKAGNISKHLNNVDDIKGVLGYHNSSTFRDNSVVEGVNAKNASIVSKNTSNANLYDSKAAVEQLRVNPALQKDFLDSTIEQLVEAGKPLEVAKHLAQFKLETALAPAATITSNANVGIQARHDATDITQTKLQGSTARDVATINGEYGLAKTQLKVEGDKLKAEISVGKPPPKVQLANYIAKQDNEALDLISKVHSKQATVDDLRKFVVSEAPLWKASLVANDHKSIVNLGARAGGFQQLSSGYKGAISSLGMVQSPIANLASKTGIGMDKIGELFRRTYAGEVTGYAHENFGSAMSTGELNRLSQFLAPTNHSDKAIKSSIIAFMEEDLHKLDSVVANSNGAEVGKLVMAKQRTSLVKMINFMKSGK